MASDSRGPIEVFAPVSGKIEYMCDDRATIEVGQGFIVIRTGTGSLEVVRSRWNGRVNPLVNEYDWVDMNAVIARIEPLAQPEASPRPAGPRAETRAVKAVGASREHQEVGPGFHRHSRMLNRPIPPGLRKYGLGVALGVLGGFAAFSTDPDLNVAEKIGFTLFAAVLFAFLSIGVTDAVTDLTCLAIFGPADA